MCPLQPSLHCALYLKRWNPLLGQSKWSILQYFILFQVEWFFFLIFIKSEICHKTIADFLSPPPVYCFWARALFCTGNAKFGPILANLGHFVANLCTFGCSVTGRWWPKIEKFKVCTKPFPTNKHGSGLRCSWNCWFCICNFYLLKRRIWIT